MAKYDYSKIKVLKKEILETATSRWLKNEITKEVWEKSFDEYEKEIGRQVDRETFLAYEYCKFDYHVDVTELLCTMERCYPGISQRWVLLQIGKLIAEDSEIGSTKNPYLNHNYLNESVRELGMCTTELLGLTRT